MISAPITRLLVVTLALLGVIAGGWFARVSIAEAEASLTNRRATIARLQAAAEESRAVLAAPQADRTAALAGDFLAGAQDPIIVAELQNRVRTLALASQVEFNSANALPPRTAEGIGYLGLRVQLRGQLRDIQAVLHAIETGTPLLFVERAALRVDSWPMKSSDAARDGRPALIADVDVFGARLPSSPPASPAAGGDNSGNGSGVPWLADKPGRRS